MMYPDALPAILGDSTYSSISDLVATLFTGTTMLVLVLIFSCSLLILLGGYVYHSLALQRVANKFGNEHSWFAWIPFLNRYLLLEIAGLNPLLVLLFIAPVLLTPFTVIPILNFFVLIVNAFAGIAIVVITTIAYMNLCKKKKYDKMLGLISLIEIGRFVLIGMLAWGKDKK